MFYLFNLSESQMVNKNNEVLKLFVEARQTETSLEKELLQSKNFMLLTYDSMVLYESQIETICHQFKSENLDLYKKYEAMNLALAIDNYCEAMKVKFEHVELFKSKNAILRNSVYFIQKIAAESNFRIRHSANYLVKDELLKLTLAFALAANEEAKKALVVVLNKVTRPKYASDEDLQSIIPHSQQIFAIKDSLDEITREAIHSRTANLLEVLRSEYFQLYANAESKATFYKFVVFSVTLLFLTFVILGIILLMRAAQRLREANSNLEQKVQVRTKELMLSKETIIKQQQTLISTAKLSSLGEMAGGIAHEINTPLAVIGMRVEQLQECIEDGSAGKDDLLIGLSVIQVTTDRIARIIRGLRFFAREGKSSPTSMTSVNKIVYDTLSFCQEKFSNNGVSVEIKLEEDKNLEIDCRPIEISQILLNLLNNSYDAIGELDIKKWIRIEVVDRSDFVEISITDCGQGIPAHVRDKLMQPFFTTKEIGKGTGLGLSISRGIAQSHNGKFYYDVHAPNTCFTLMLPKRQPTDEISSVQDVA